MNGNRGRPRHRGLGGEEPGRSPPPSPPLRVNCIIPFPTSTSLVDGTGRDATRRDDMRRTFNTSGTSTLCSRQEKVSKQPGKIQRLRLIQASTIPPSFVPSHTTTFASPEGVNQHTLSVIPSSAKTLANSSPPSLKCAQSS